MLNITNMGECLLWCQNMGSGSEMRQNGGKLTSWVVVINLAETSQRARKAQFKKSLRAGRDFRKGIWNRGEVMRGREEKGRSGLLRKSGTWLLWDGWWKIVGRNGEEGKNGGIGDREEKYRRANSLDFRQEKRRSWIRILGKNAYVLTQQSIINLLGQEANTICIAEC